MSAVKQSPMTVVIPTLNAEALLPRLLAQFAGWSVIVADGGSTDRTVCLAVAGGARVVIAAKGRGFQLAAGADAAGKSAGAGPWLLFLHADTVLGDEWQDAVAKFTADPANLRRAGYFRLRFASESPAAQRVACLANWRARCLGLPYGDQGLVISRAFYEAVGGYPPWPLMEDVALVRRIGRHRLVALDAEAITAADRYERDGWLWRPLRNLLCLALYFFGVPPVRIARIYR